MSTSDKLDQAQIVRKTYDSVNESVKVSLQNTEIAIELSAVDGDSVTSVPSKLVASVTGVVSPTDDGATIIPAIDCSSLSSVRVDINGTGAVSIMVSPSDTGSYFYSVGGAGSIISICARRIKVVSTNANGDVYLVGKS
jgi:hypothetical protein